MNTDDLAGLLTGLQLAFGDDWTKEEAPPGRVRYVHSDGHRIGLRAQSGGVAVQTWITAGPTLPPIPETGPAEEKAEAQAANDACLQPGRTWHAVIHTRHTGDLTQTIADVVRDQLIPALANKPKRALTLSHDPKPAPAPTKPRKNTRKRKDTSK